MGLVKKARILAVKDVLTTAFAALEAVGFAQMIETEPAQAT